MEDKMHIKLSNGVNMPIVGSGLYFGPQENWTESQVAELVKTAIDCGYRAFDTAVMYGTEAALGKAIQAKIADETVTREELFITSKLPEFANQPECVCPGVTKSLHVLGLDFVDLYLIHSPCGFKDDTISELDQSNDHILTWKKLEDCVRKGQIGSIGIANFNARQVQNVLDNATIKPVMNQIEVHPYLRNEKLVKYCQDRRVQVTAYTPLGQPFLQGPKGKLREDFIGPLDEPVIIGLAEKYNKSPAQISLRHLIQRNLAVIPKSSNPERLKENINLFDFELSEEDMTSLAALDKHLRAWIYEYIAGHKDYPFNEEF